MVNLGLMDKLVVGYILSILDKESEAFRKYTFYNYYNGCWNLYNLYSNHIDKNNIKEKSLATHASIVMS